MNRVLILLVFLLLPSTESGAITLHVSKSGDRTDGLSWLTAYTAIGDALTVSASGDEIWVKAETFEENIVVVTPVTILGGFAGTEEDTADLPTGAETTYTTIDGMESGSVIRATAALVCERLILTRGKAEKGGGIYVNTTSLRCRDCVIKDCVTRLPYGLRGYGGGIYAVRSMVKLEWCEIHHNMAAFGGGIQGGSPIIMDSCRVFKNAAIQTIDTSTSLPFFWGGSGGGILVGGEGDIRNTLIYDNSGVEGASLWSGKIREGGLIVENCSIIAAHSSSIFYNEGLDSRPKPTFRNCIIRGNNKPFSSSRPDLNLEPVTAMYCNIQGGYSGEGNINADPLFVDSANNDYHLLPGSPCIDSGTTGTDTDFDGNPRPVDVPGQGRDGTGDEFDMGAFEFQLPQGDLNANGLIDPMDLFIFSGDWMKMTHG